MKENLYRGPQFTFFFFYRKSLIGVWYGNLRNPVKATYLGHPRHTKARPQYKAFNIYKFFMGGRVPVCPGRGRQTETGHMVRPWRKQKRCPDILDKGGEGRAWRHDTRLRD
jgi:hypothetical protein